MTSRIMFSQRQLDEAWRFIVLLEEEGGKAHSSFAGCFALNLVPFKDPTLTSGYLPQHSRSLKKKDHPYIHPSANTPYHIMKAKERIRY